MEFKRFLQSARYVTFFSAWKRGNYIRKKKIFGMVGDNVRLPLMIIPFRSENIFIHNNVEIASGFRLVPHDAIHGVFNGIPGNGNIMKEHIGKIEIYDNVFIGANAIVLGPCKIGPNVIVGAGAVVCNDIPPGTVCGGVPAKIIGNFEELRMKRERLKNVK